MKTFLYAILTLVLLQTISYADFDFRNRPGNLFEMSSNFPYAPESAIKCRDWALAQYQAFRSNQTKAKLTLWKLIPGVDPFSQAACLKCQVAFEHYGANYDGALTNLKSGNNFDMDHKKDIEYITRYFSAEWNALVESYRPYEVQPFMVRAYKPDDNSPAFASINYRVFLSGVQPDAFDSFIGSEILHSTLDQAEEMLLKYEDLLLLIYAKEDLHILKRSILETEIIDPVTGNKSKRYQDQVHYEVR